jgi:hypothetical protein
LNFYGIKALVLHKSAVEALRQEGVFRVNAQFMSIYMRFKGREASVKRLPNRAVEANFERPYYAVDRLTQASAENQFARLVLVKPGEDTPAWVCRPCFRKIPAGITGVQWKDIYILYDSTDLVYSRRTATYLPVIPCSTIDNIYEHDFTLK